jgi:hypothetical protein
MWTMSFTPSYLITQCLQKRGSAFGRRKNSVWSPDEGSAEQARDVAASRKAKEVVFHHSHDCHPQIAAVENLRVGDAQAVQAPLVLQKRLVQSGQLQDGVRDGEREKDRGREGEPMKKGKAEKREERREKKGP